MGNKYFLTQKRFFVLLFIASFVCVQGLSWLLGGRSLPVAAQTPAAVTNTTTTVNPENLLQEARRLYQAEQFSEAQTLLEQAVSGFAAKGDVLKQAIALDLRGQVYLAAGQPEAAADSFSAAATAYERGRDKTGVVKSRINQAQALRNGGYFRRALDILEQLTANLLEKIDPQLKAMQLRSLAITQRLIGKLEDAQKNIEESLKIAQELPSPAREQHISAAYLILGNIAKDRGNTIKERNQNSEAQDTFTVAIAYYKAAAKTATTPTATIEAQLNQLSTVGDSGQSFSDAERELLRQVRETLDKLPLSRIAVQSRINWARMATDPNNKANISPQDIVQQLATALDGARKLKDQRSESYALGELGALRQKLGQRDKAQLNQAQENTKQALQVAQAIGATDIAYRWQWQLAQILKAQGKTEGAIASYDAAVKNLESIRGDLVSVNPDVQFSFRESIEPVYREYAGLLLQSKNPEDLKQARKAIESLQQAELVNFFRENCITAKSKSVDEILAETDQKAALIYPIVLQDSLEVVVTLPGNRLEHTSIPIKRVDAQATFQRLRRAIAPVDDTSIRATPNPNQQNPTTPENPESNRSGATIVITSKQGEGYQELAKQVYDWLIRPFENAIKASGVETLVFVLDGPMLNLPMAVLNDGEKFLVEKYAIAQTPGLQLLDPKPLPRGQLTALKAGLSKARNLPIRGSGQPVQFPALPNVEQELKGIQAEVSGQLILNDKFTVTAIQQAIESVSFPVVHLATHGQFSSNAEETFILTWNGPLPVNDLGKVLRGREEGGRRAIELLVLSACETATGDERAALGLAGVAVKAGARSTLATLWTVDDKSTADLMVQFYKELKNPQTSKAQALRIAQLGLIHKGSKPEDWAPFVLLGNWL